MSLEDAKLVMDLVDKDRMKQRTYGGEAKLAYFQMQLLYNLINEVRLLRDDIKGLNVKH